MSGAFGQFVFGQSPFGGTPTSGATTPVNTPTGPVLINPVSALENSVPIQPNTIQRVTGGNLFQYAAQYLNDATQFVRLMRQNDLTDPQLMGQVTLVVPPVDPTLTGGLPNV